MPYLSNEILPKCVLLKPSQGPSLCCSTEQKNRFKQVRNRQYNDQYSSYAFKFRGDCARFYCALSVGEKLSNKVNLKGISQQNNSIHSKTMSCWCAVRFFHISAAREKGLGKTDLHHRRCTCSMVIIQNVAN